MSKRNKLRSKLEELKQKRLNKGLHLNPPSELGSEGGSLSAQEDRDIVETSDQISEDGDSDNPQPNSEEDPNNEELLSQTSDDQNPENSDHYESDFIVEDGEFGINLASAGVPLHLTSHAGMKPFDYFKTAVEWMVHNKLNPAFHRHDEIYQMAHDKLDDEVKGRAQSTFNSTAWSSGFTMALKSRPDLDVAEFRIDEAMTISTKCEACNRAKHPPRYRVTLKGNSYDPKTLEAIRKRNSDDASDSENDSSEGEEEEAEPEQHFMLGRHCFANAEIAHTLQHWRYQLNQQILQWLQDAGHLSADKVIERESLSHRKKEKYANRIVDGMNDTGEMRDLYDMFRKTLHAARSAKVSLQSLGSSTAFLS